MATARQKQKVEDAAIELARAKAALQEAQQKFDEAFKEATAGSKSKKPTDAKLGESQNETGNGADSTSMQKIEAVLLSDAGKSFSYSEIAKQTGLPVPSIKAFLFRLKKHGKADRVGWDSGKLDNLRF